ncbi:MAG TPA: hypothetical protein DDZ89_19080, partial [Clostridiales bacterium]|nr:hypothetical protein [Clostridiales bacterium]
EEGILWGTTGLGQTMFGYNPETGEYWNTDIVTVHGGEVYGIVSHNNKIYMTSYSGGDHMVYDPKQEWNQYENVNPHTLESIGPDYIRPQARSFVGPNDNVWTGWIAQYGKYGCAITEIDTKTHEVRKYTDLVPGQGIGAITADAENIYFTTNGSGNGLKSKSEEFYLVKMTKDGEILNKKKFPLGTGLSCVYVVNDKVLLYTMADGKSILRIYNGATMEEEKSTELDYVMGRMISMSNGNILAAIHKRGENRRYSALAVMDPATLEFIQESELPGHSHAFCYNQKDGFIYFGHGSKLYRLKGE